MGRSVPCESSRQALPANYWSRSFEAQLDLEFAVTVAVLPRDVQVEEAQSLAAVPADVGVSSPPPGRRGSMVPSASDLSLYPLGV